MPSAPRVRDPTTPEPRVVHLEREVVVSAGTTEGLPGLRDRHDQQQRHDPTATGKASDRTEGGLTAPPRKQPGAGPGTAGRKSGRPLPVPRAGGYTHKSPPAKRLRLLSDAASLGQADRAVRAGAPRPAVVDRMPHHVGWPVHPANKQPPHAGDRRVEHGLGSNDERIAGSRTMGKHDIDPAHQREGDAGGVQGAPVLPRPDP